MTEMIDEHFDAQGNVRRFVLCERVGFLDAHELRPDGRAGLRFVLPIRPDEIPPYGEMRDRIRERLSRRDVVRVRGGELELLNRTVRAQIVDRTDDGLPVLQVDDTIVEWAELGRMLARFEGFGLRVEVCESGEE